MQQQVWVQCPKGEQGCLLRHSHQQLLAAALRRFRAYLCQQQQPMVAIHEQQRARGHVKEQE
jgi:ABC-type cobalamin transport system ATPase subunit